MRLYTVRFEIWSSAGYCLSGLDPIVFKFYWSSGLDHTIPAFNRMLVEFGRSVGFTGSYAKILSVYC